MRRVHTIALLALLATSAAPMARAQLGPPNQPAPGWTYKTNFAIPDAPAFELLAVDPATILRPQSTRELALSLSKFQSAEGSFTIPRALALEFSPAILMRGDRLTQKGFAKNPALYNFRVSVAALRDQETGANASMALGFRYTLADQSQLKTDAAYPADMQVTELTAQALKIYTAAIGREGGAPVLNASDQEKIDALAKEIRKRFAERYWNAGRMELAFALRASAADSTGRDPKLDAFSGWFSATRGAGTWGQALFGARVATRRDSLNGDYRQESSLAFRFYAGSSNAKGFVEAQQTMRDDAAPALFVDGGFEMAPAEWVWLDFSFGVEHSAGRSHAVSTFTLKTALPGM
jgi:hypothetical protein